MDHGIECVGFRVAQAGCVAVFAIDTCPSPEVVENARGAGLLVHEAYGLEDTAEHTHALGHSTAAEAGEVARAANVRRLVLTHLRAKRFVEPRSLAAEAKSAFGGPVEAAGDLDTFGF